MTPAAAHDKTSEIAASLHRLERAVLPHLAKYSSVTDIITAAKMQEVEVLRALHWLQNKGLAKITETIEEVVSLGKNGQQYAKAQLPETRFLNALRSKPLQLSEIKKAANLSDDEIGASIGALMRLRAIEPAASAGEKTFRLSEAGKELAKAGLKAQRFLSEKRFPVKVKELSEEEKRVLAELKMRKDVLAEEIIKNRTAVLTEAGKEVLKKAGTTRETVDRLTPELLVTGKWKNSSFRSYDLTTPTPRVFFRRLQP